MPAASERIVIQTTVQEKRAIVAKAKKLGVPISELMRRGAASYSPEQSDSDLTALADAAVLATRRAASSIDDSLAFIEASNRRIAALESRHARRPRKTH